MEYQVEQLQNLSITIPFSMMPDNEMGLSFSKTERDESSVNKIYCVLNHLSVSLAPPFTRKSSIDQSLISLSH